jgi:hypothetical protein
VLAMLARKGRAARGSARLRSCRQEAALLTRPALPWPSETIGARNAPKDFDGLRRIEQGTPERQRKRHTDQQLSHPLPIRPVLGNPVPLAFGKIAFQIRLRIRAREPLREIPPHFQGSLAFVQQRKINPVATLAAIAERSQATAYPDHQRQNKVALCFRSRPANARYRRPVSTQAKGDKRFLCCRSWVFPSCVLNGCAVAADAHCCAVATGRRGSSLPSLRGQNSQGRLRFGATPSVEFGGFSDFRDGVQVASFRLQNGAATQGETPATA